MNESYIYVDLNAVGNASHFFSTAKNAAADWFARYAQITFVQSAGNNKFTDAPSREFVLCQQLNGICVGSVKDEGTLPSKSSIGYNGAYLNDVMATDSRWKNPRINISGSVFDPGVERPDVVSQGEGVWVANPNTESEWEKVGGTSFAAPVITGLIALEKEVCGNVSDQPVVWRSKFRNRAGRAHTLESAPSFVLPASV